jgi:hypothetical protein
MPMKTIISRSRTASPGVRRDDLLEDHRPREEEGDFQIEQDEDDGNQVVAHVELHARILEGLEAALERGSFSLSGRLGAISQPSRMGTQPEGQADEYEDEDRKIIFQHSLRKPDLWPGHPPGPSRPLPVMPTPALQSRPSEIVSGADGETRTHTAFATTPSR